MRATKWLAVALLALAACRIYIIPGPTPAEHAGAGRWRSPARAARDGSVRFVALGDWGYDNAVHRRVAASLGALVRRHGYRFVLTLGDNFYPAGVSGVDDPQWQRKFEARYAHHGLPFLPTLGNHDWRQDGSPQWRYRGPSRLWQMPAPYYSFTVGQVLFVALDTTRWEARQQRWLAELLDRSTARWKVVYGHHPIYSHGLHGPTGVLYHHLRPLLEGRVDFYLSGHDHDKELIHYGPRPAYVISGAAASPRMVGAGPGTLFFSSSPGVVGFEIARDRATLRFHDDAGGTEFRRIYRRIYVSPAPRQARVTR